MCFTAGGDGKFEVVIVFLLVFLGAVVVLPIGLVLRNDVSGLDAATDFTALGRTCAITSLKVRL